MGRYTDKKNDQKFPIGQVIGITAFLASIFYFSFPRDKSEDETNHEATQVQFKATEEEARKEREWRKAQAELRAIEMQRSAAEERNRALTEWDNAIRNDIEDRRAKLRKASTRVVTDASGSVRVDAYHLKNGNVIYCSTKVISTGPLMTCDGELD